MTAQRQLRTRLSKSSDATNFHGSSPVDKVPPNQRPVRSSSSRRGAWGVRPPLHPSASAQRSQLPLGGGESVSDGVPTSDRIGGGGKTNTQCTTVMARCLRLFQEMWAVEDCNLFRTQLACLQVEQRRRLCRGYLMYHSLVTSTENLISKKCSDKNPRPLPPIVAPLDPYVGGGGHGERDKDEGRPISNLPSRCYYPGAPPGSGYRVCAVYGDPHVRLFNGSQQTCRLGGSWPLLDNRFLSVQVTSSEVVLGEGAMAVTKLTVLLRNDGECLTGTHFHSYTAEASLGLPLTFDNGLKEISSGAVVITSPLVKPPTSSSRGNQRESSSGDAWSTQHREIWLRHIDTRLIIRRVGRYLTVALRSPQEILSQLGHSRLQVRELCQKGCPAFEEQAHSPLLKWSREQRRRQHYSSSGASPTPPLSAAFPALNRISQSRAEHVCRKVGLTGSFFDNCVFDLMMSGDLQMAKNVLAAMRDVSHLISGDRRRLLTSPHPSNNRTRYRPYVPNWLMLKSSASGDNSSLWACLTAILITFILPWYH